MKLRITLLMLLALIALPVLAQDGSTLTFDNFGFRFDSSLAASVNITQFPGDLTDAQQPGGPEVRHTQFVLYNEFPTPESIFDAPIAIRVYRTADFTGYEFPSAELQKLQSLLAERPDLATFMAIAEASNEGALPFMPVLPASQVIRARAEYVETPALQGIRYVTVYRQDASPFLGNEFLYTFQGISNDGASYVAVVARLNTELFPSELPADFEVDAFITTMNEYLAESVATLNAATPDDFTPSLTALDALVQTFTFTDAGTVEPTPVPASTATATSVPSALGGLAGVTWRLISYGSVESPQTVLENTTITLTFSEQGIGGSSGCNSYFGSFQFDVNAMTISGIGSTLIACEQPIMDQETAYLNALATATSYQLSDGQLQIFYEGGVLTFAGEAP